MERRTHLLLASALPLLLVVLWWQPAPVAVRIEAGAASALQRPGPAPATAPAVDEFVGPFPSWVNLRTRDGAAGDGVADDSAAFQAAFDRLGQEGQSPVIFVPAGTYRITHTLTLSYQLGVSLLGEDPERTRIVWDGPADGTMLVVNGVAYSRIGRLTFDGQGRARTAVEQAWDGKKGNFDTGNEYADDRFIDVGYGIRGGFLDYGFAETSVVRNRFLRNTTAGIALGNFNALDLWVWQSLFEDCGVGITNDPGAGNYRVYQSVFRRSRVADLVMQNTGAFTARGNYSVGSKAFWISGPSINHPDAVDIQDNTIIDSQSAVTIRIGNQGPAVILDNRVRSLPNTGGPIISWTSLFGSDVVSLGNTFTVSAAVHANGRFVTLDDRIVTRDAIDATEPPLPSAWPNRGRRVYEVAAGAPAAAIQEAIDTAVRDGSPRPVIHVPAAIYPIDRTLTVPASDVQIVGDGMWTRLQWAGVGTGPVLVLQAPSRATLREFRVMGSRNGDGIVAAGVDQPGSRAYFEGLQLRGGRESNLWVSSPGAASIQLVDVGHGASDGVSLHADGAGQTVIYSGASSGSRLSYDVSAGAKLLARDIWYEGTAEGGFARVRDDGEFAMQGSRVATPEGWTPPSFVVDTTARRFTLLTTLFDDRIVVLGSRGHADILALANLRAASTRPLFSNNSASPATALMLNLRQRVAAGGLIPRNTVPVPDVGTIDADFLRTMLREVRSVPPPSLEPTPPGASDLRVFRVWSENARVNVRLSGKP